MNTPIEAYVCARDILKCRSRVVEKEVIKSPLFAYLYAKNIIKSRWFEAEPVIKSNKTVWFAYIFHFTNLEKKEKNLWKNGF